MLHYTDSEKYKRDPHFIIHFVLIIICGMVILLGALLYFHQ